MTKAISMTQVTINRIIKISWTVSTGVLTALMDFNFKFSIVKSLSNSAFLFASVFILFTNRLKKTILIL